SGAAVTGRADERVSGGGVGKWIQWGAARATERRARASTARSRTVKVVGYSDPLSVAPGETIRFMVSCEEPGYRAEIVRLIHGDLNPAGPGFKEQPVATAAGGEYAGRVQTLPRGSHVLVADSLALRPGGSFTL